MADRLERIMVPTRYSPPSESMCIDKRHTERIFEE